MSWTSIYTGLSKKQHGYERGWIPFLQQNQKINDKFPCVWQDIQNRGYTVGLFSLPLTYPAFPVDKWIVSGFPSLPKPDRRAYPLEINEYLTQHMHALDLHYQSGQYPDDPRPKGGVHLNFEDIDAHNRILNHITNRLNVLDTILADNPVDVVMAGYSYLDHAGHLGFNTNGLYKNGVVNMSIETLMDICQPKKVLIVSDHGAYFWLTPIRSEEPDIDGIVSIGLNHSKNGVLHIIGAEIKHKKRYEWNIKQAILDVLDYGT